MKIETKKVYKCDCCGCCFSTFVECKEHEDGHFDINNIPTTRQFYEVGKDIPFRIVVDGYRIKNGKVETKQFVYKWEGEY
ncbi:MAG: hypothetical protein J6T10_05570 [Methanobrevibacter sp.]|nr:hypothetical protein [Methanobrevibacter sp.]